MRRLAQLPKTFLYVSASLWKTPPGDRLEAMVMKSTRRGNFFAVEYQRWLDVSNVGINAMAAYLCLARYSGPDNKSSSASVHAIENHTPLSRGMAQKAISDLKLECLIKQTKFGTHPKYDLRPVACHQLSSSQARVLALVKKNGEARLDKCDLPSARVLVRFDLLMETNDEGVFKIKKPDLIWLPNELVDGACQEVPPLYKAWETRDPHVLRWLVHLYHEQNLAEHGGVDPQLFHYEYEREQVGQKGEFTVWGFQFQRTVMRHIGPFDGPEFKGSTEMETFWLKMKLLTDIGAFEHVPMFCLDDGETENGYTEFVPVHPVGWGPWFEEDSPEVKFSVAAQNAAASLLTAGQREWANERGLILIPALRHQVNVAMVGVLRARYRPHTSKTAAWWARMKEAEDVYLKRYLELKSRYAEHNSLA